MESICDVSRHGKIKLILKNMVERGCGNEEPRALYP